MIRVKVGTVANYGHGPQSGFAENRTPIRWLTATRSAIELRTRKPRGLASPGARCLIVIERLGRRRAGPVYPALSNRTGRGGQSRTANLLIKSQLLLPVELHPDFHKKPNLRWATNSGRRETRTPSLAGKSRLHTQLC